MTSPYRKLADSGQGLIDRSIFSDETLYRQEMQQIFGHAWLFVGHVGQIPQPFDYITSRMGESSVIVSRDGDGQIHVMLNICRHRGMKVCRYDSGNARSFTCPYHAWSYSVDSKLVARAGDLFGVPGYEENYAGILDKSEWGLQRAKVEIYKGTIWATWDHEAPDLLTYLGDMVHYLDSALHHRDGSDTESEVFVGVQKWRVPCNWKIGSENFMGDYYMMSAIGRSISQTSGPAAPVAGIIEKPLCIDRPASAFVAWVMRWWEHCLTLRSLSICPSIRIILSLWPTTERFTSGGSRIWDQECA